MKTLQKLKNAKISLVISESIDWDGEYITITDLKEIDKKSLFSLGFGNWDENLVLIPLWAVDIIDPNSNVVSINGTNSLLKDCDLDTRFGCIAFGFLI